MLVILKCSTCSEKGYFEGNQGSNLIIFCHKLVSYARTAVGHNGLAKNTEPCCIFSQGPSVQVKDLKWILETSRNL
jgi:hypothetical protein